MIDPDLAKSDPHHEQFVQHHGPVHSVVDTGAHPETTYESVDASVKLVIGSLAIIALTLLVTAIITVPIENLLKHANPTGNLPSPLAPERVVPSKPRIEAHPWETFPELKQRWQQELANGGTGELGEKREPINQAIQQTASSLPVRPGAGPGLTQPGGEGYDFSQGIDQMPSVYHDILQPSAAAGAPTIQGEIRKNAKK